MEEELSSAAKRVGWLFDHIKEPGRLSEMLRILASIIGEED